MKKILEFGDFYVSDFVKEQDPLNKKYNLDLYLDKTCGAVRVHPDNIPPRNKMWGKYWYRSSINTTMVNELGDIVKNIVTKIELNDNDIWLDIASNDGTLLKQVPNNLQKIGIDPAEDSFYNEATNYGKIVQDYFTADNYWSVANKRAKVITTIAMFYDLDDPGVFINDIVNILDDDGLWVLQLSYTPLMIEQKAFDNICHEHVYYHSLTSLKNLFTLYGLHIVDVVLNDTNGGSMRVFVMKSKEKYSTLSNRNVANFRIKSTYAYENVVDITNPDLWNDFKIHIESLKYNIVNTITTLNNYGYSIFGYGASTKGNTLLQYFGLNETYIKAIADRSQYKWGLKTVGSNIPIVSEEYMRTQKPNYILILPWHFMYEFKKRESALLKRGTNFIIPCPNFEIISEK